MDNATRELSTARTTVDSGSAAAQLAWLRIRARQLIIQAVHDRYLCHAGADRALRDMGLRPLLGRWYIRATLPVTFHHPPLDDDTTLEAAKQAVATACSRARGGGLDIHPDHVSVVQAVPAAEDPTGPRRRGEVTAQAGVTLPTIAVDEQTAIQRAQRLLADRAADFHPCTVLLDEVVWGELAAWEWVGFADELHHDTPTDPTVPAPASTAAPQAEPAELAALSTRIRTVAVAALTDHRLGSDDTDFQRVDEFLADVGLPGLPRVHVCYVDLWRTTTTGTTDPTTVAYTARLTTVDDHHHAAANGLPVEHVEVLDTVEPVQLDDNRWQVRWLQRWHLQLHEATPTGTVLAMVTQALPEGATSEPIQALHTAVHIDRRLGPHHD